MKKELPKMYHTKINKPVSSIQKVYSTLNPRVEPRDNREEKNILSSKYSSISIEKKIDNIFKSPDYVYKADVTIVTDKETINKVVIAKNRNNIITIDNEYIPISIIRDIYR